MLILREISSSSKSVVALPSSGRIRRSVAPAEYMRAQASDVFPACPCPIRATFRISELSWTFIEQPPSPHFWPAVTGMYHSRNKNQTAAARRADQDSGCGVAVDLHAFVICRE